MANKTKWTHKLLYEEALKYNTRKDFKKYNASAYNICIKHGILNIACKHMKKFYRKWPKEDVIKEALKYNTKGEFKKGSRNAYISCCNLGIIEQSCKHMEYNIKGFNPKKPAILYYLSINNGQAYKIGITNRSVKERYNVKDLKNILIIKQWDYPIGSEAQRVEKLIKKEYKYAKYEGNDLLENGNSELFIFDILDLDKVNT